MPTHKPQPLYREVLKKSWRLTWQHKQLWLFGFFATFLGMSGVFEVLARGLARTQNVGENFYALVELAYPGAPVAGTLVTNADRLTIGGLLVLLAIAVIFVGLLWFVSVSEGALIWSIKGTGRVAPKLEKSFQGARSAGWRIAGYHVIAKLVLGLGFLLTSLPLILVSVETTWTNTIIYFVSFLIFFPLVLIVSFLTIYTVCAAVIHNLGFYEAIVSAWSVLHKHWIISLETALLLFGVTFLATILVGMAAMLLLIPFSLLLMAAVLSGSAALTAVIFTIFIIILAGMALLVGSVITTFQLITWTQLFIRLEKKGGVAKVVRLFTALPHFILHRS